MPTRNSAQTLNHEGKASVDISQTHAHFQSVAYKMALFLQYLWLFLLPGTFACSSSGRTTPEVKPVSAVGGLTEATAAAAVTTTTTIPQSTLKPMIPTNWTTTPPGQWAMVVAGIGIDKKFQVCQPQIIRYLVPIN